MDFIKNLFEYTNFMPHGHCYLWRKDILYTHLISDTLIFLAYFSIPIALVYLVKKRKDIPMNSVFFLFAGFILFCGITHIFAVYTTFVPSYRVEGILKAITAIVSIFTAIAVWWLMPTALAIPSNKETRKKNEQLKMYNEELSKFAYVTSHDLREPLRKIETYANILAEGYSDKNDDEFNSLIEKAKTSAAYMNKFINDLSDYVNLSNKEKSQSWIDLNKVVNDIINELEMKIQQLHASIDVSDLATVYGNEVDMKILLRNLISNGLKYKRDEVAPVVKIWTKENSDAIEIHIQDNGMGIPEDKQQVIFEPFKRLHDKTKYEGTGVGLALCKKIVFMNKGEIFVKNNSDQPGSEFVVIFNKRD